MSLSPHAVKNGLPGNPVLQSDNLQQVNHISSCLENQSNKQIHKKLLFFFYRLCINGFNMLII